MENMENNPQTGAQGAGSPQEPQNSEKLFTQAEVDKIIGERLARERKEPDPKELELKAREQDLYIRELIADKKLPEDAAETLKGLDKETVDKFIKILSPYLEKAKEPILNPTGHTNDGTGVDAIREAMGLKG